MQKRNYTLDILKVIALMAIILAHVNPNRFIFQLRNFDVPLMIIISVWLSLRTIQKENFKYKNYIYSRIKRLIIPTWIFLTMYFLILYLIGKPSNIKSIIMSYSLIGGIGYVWVIRIYIYVAILTPVINKIYNSMKIWQFISLFGFIYFMYLLLVNEVNLLSGPIKTLISATVVDFIGYSFVVFVAIITFNLRKKDIFKIGLTFVTIFILLAIKNQFIQTQNFKYPVRLYYLSYAFVVSIFLYLFIDKLNDNNKLKKFKIIDYISRNSMWIYLWHIIYIPNINKLFLDNNAGFVYRLLLLVLLSVITTFIQNHIKYIFRNNTNIYYKNNDFTSRSN